MLASVYLFWDMFNGVQSGVLFTAGVHCPNKEVKPILILDWPCFWSCRLTRGISAWHSSDVGFIMTNVTCTVCFVCDWVHWSSLSTSSN